MNDRPQKKHIMSVLVIICGIFGYFNSAMATVADGVFAYEKGDYIRARTEWLPYAALGNANALYNLGQLSRMGRGVEQDYAKAEEYYLRAAKKGHVGAQRNLGTLYYFGRINEVNYTKALDWLLKAAIQDDHKSQLMVGTLYYNGEVTETDNITAYAWIFLAAQSGLTQAIDSLKKLEQVMTTDQVEQAKKKAPTLIFRQLSPDDVGLMVQQAEESTAELKAVAPHEPVAAEMAEDETSPPEPSVTEAADNFRVQLASFRNDEAAQKSLAALKDKFPDIFSAHEAKIEYADLGDKGIYYRLQLAPFEVKTDANEICARLRENGQGCYVVKTP